MVLATTVLGSVVGAIGPAAAQSYPSRTITLVVPFAPGGSTSIVGRTIAEKMSEILGQQIVVDNRGGAGGTVGTRAVARSAPDGYTLLLGYTGTLAIGPTLYKNAGYDPRKDFAPIGMIGHAPNSLVVHPATPAKSVPELIAYAKANPGKVNYGSAGVGTVSHVSGAYFAGAAGITLVHVPYKGTGPALADLIGGHIPMAFAPIPATHGPISQGLLRGLAVTSATRSSLMPELPTIAESGVKDFEASLYYGLVAPAGTPRAIIDRLNQVLREALTSAEVRKRLANDGAEATPGSPEDYAVHIDRDERRWSVVVKASGASGN
ncbi:MAG: tripartite tricarboxylate transporter substrate binding protein [Hyphomicrobiales bacterium]|nr:tripartite tricarboxylate transporter substrate binding protein [Hyphomicrobiales bacterium]